MHWIMGKNCLEELLKSAPERIITVFSNKKEDPLCEAIQEKGISLRLVSKETLYSMVDSDSHQSFVAKVKEKEEITLKEFLKDSNEKEKSLVLLCDSIFDPQNLGAIIRASECFGIDALLYSKNRGAPLSAVVAKASVGASEILPLLSVSNLRDAMKKFQDEGYQAVVAEKREGSSLYGFTFPEKTLLIVGSEGKGVQKILRETADYSVEIPLFGRIDSLNVSQATTLFLSEWRRQQS
ncbi:MAG: 23S rRNA (guanosine(2251)-2'-O)-methyltransferase RlmB [Simkania negevensis]|nr:23S rRNA (guanosine(2251)-2'-O)-methyltransferase RlmB [Simkania negevensis]